MRQETLDRANKLNNNIMEGEPTTIPTQTIHSDVDLGLPSGNLWADRNLCASSPEDYGAFFSWGNIEPHMPKKDNTDWGDTEDAFDYHFSPDEYDGTPGSMLEDDIDPEHDAAQAILGTPWQMPTADDFQELYDNCDWTRKTINGVNGYLVTSKINGNTIFFPAAGYGLGSSWDSRCAFGYYWSSSFSSARYVQYLFLFAGGVCPQQTGTRYGGFTIRPIRRTIHKK